MRYFAAKRIKKFLAQLIATLPDLHSNNGHDANNTGPPADVKATG